MVSAKEEPSIILVGQTASTNELAMEALSKGAPQGTVFIADRQRAGRGRRRGAGEHKAWYSPAGRNIYVSVVLRPNLEVERLSAITLAVGVKLAEILRAETGLDIWLKWPNDLYIGARKLGGVLTEGVVGQRGVEGAVVGVGINVNMDGEELPEELLAVATSLKMESGVVQDRLNLVLALVEGILSASDEYAAQGLEAFLGRIDRLDRLKGRPVEVDMEEGPLRGRAEGVGERGGLKVRFAGGEIREILGGEVRAHGLGGVILDGEE